MVFFFVCVALIISSFALFFFFCTYTFFLSILYWDECLFFHRQMSMLDIDLFGVFKMQIAPKYFAMVPFVVSPSRLNLSMPIWLYHFWCWLLVVFFFISSFFLLLNILAVYYFEPNEMRYRYSVASEHHDWLKTEMHNLM